MGYKHFKILKNCGRHLVDSKNKKYIFLRANQNLAVDALRSIFIPAF